MRRLALLLLLAASRMIVGQDATARTIYDKALAAKPKPDKLKFYDLDWAGNLTQARQRAQEEKRPIVLLWVTNITAGCDFFTGHT
ncbi:MAG TPA: hypothetical protein PLN21_10390 [Gemmatales bacterium]|nr:hypothetical protein [Gemmatales bacterium]